MKTVAFIPIKLNNERCHNKNIRSFKNGKPLIQYILNTVKTVKNIDETYVYCSSEEIKKYLPSDIKFLKREEYLDKADTSFNEVLTTFKDKVESDVYVLTHSTAPFLSKETFETSIEQVKSGMYDSAIAVQVVQEFLWKDNKPFNYDIFNIPRTQDLEPLYSETCGMFVYTKKVINENRRIGDSVYLHPVSKIEAVDINTEVDFMIAEAIFNGTICGVTGNL